VLTATIQDDLDDIGKYLVGLVLEGGGFVVLDLGVDVSPERLVAVVRANQVDIVALSTLLMTTMPNLRLAIEALEAAGLRDRVRVMVGGAPVTDRFSRQIGADGYAPDAYKAVALARSLLS
jgi:5-methyltetrahydrofolate--homocysteine methyltransferase